MEQFTEFVLDPRFLFGVTAGSLLLTLWWFIIGRGSGYRRTTVTVALPFGLGSVTYEISEEDRRAAWQLYVQLKTRKATLPFDTQNDLLVEVLDSVYEVVDITRGLLTAMPLPSTESIGVSDLMLRVLNDGLRPFLTRWQADFRRWWDLAIEDPADREERPQAIQRLYPRFEELVQDLIQMNQNLDEYARGLLAVALPQRRGPRLRQRPQPVRPTGNGNDTSP